MTMSNAAYSTEAHFKAACQKAKEVFGLDIQPTAAQASKYRRGFGAAYNAEYNQTLGSRVGFKERPEVVELNRASGKPGKIMDYGPYSATPNNQKPAPLAPSKRS